MLLGASGDRVVQLSPIGVRAMNSLGDGQSISGLDHPLAVEVFILSDHLQRPLSEELGEALRQFAR